MDIIIPYRDDNNGGEELRFALRSIEKNLSGYDRIIIVSSSFPQWLTNVDKLIFFEESVKSPRNIMNKILFAMKAKKISTAVQWQDDIYLTRKLHVNDIKYWYSGTIESMIEKSIGRYRTMVKNTLTLLGPGAKYFDIHTPIIYNIDALFDVSIVFDWGNNEFLLKSLYCRNTPGEEMKDGKLKQGEPEESILNIFNENLFVSSGPYSFNDTMKKILKSKYSEKSIYEK